MQEHLLEKQMNHLAIEVANTALRVAGLMAEKELAYEQLEQERQAHQETLIRVAELEKLLQVTNEKEVEENGGN